uniref:Uncharacterized protein n=1 Tax=Romanomermis culicivorax TaxID=13658 RepID=A0A915IDB2_ROMCU
MNQSYFNCGEFLHQNYAPFGIINISICKLFSSIFWFCQKAYVPWPNTKLQCQTGHHDPQTRPVVQRNYFRYWPANPKESVLVDNGKASQLLEFVREDDAYK